MNIECTTANLLSLSMYISPDLILVVPCFHCSHWQLQSRCIFHSLKVCLHSDTICVSNISDSIRILRGMTLVSTTSCSHILFQTLQMMSDVLASNFSVPQPADTAGVVGPSSSHSIPPMPKHMRLDEWPFPYPLPALLQCFFTGLCILANGHTTLERVWITAVEDGEMWTQKKMLMTTRLNQNNVTVSHRPPTQQQYRDILMIRADCFSLP